MVDFRCPKRATQLLPCRRGMDAPIDLNRLAALREEKPRSLMAYIRFAWPEIKAALERGHTLKAVHQCTRAEHWRGRIAGKGRRYSGERLERSAGERSRKDEKTAGIQLQ